MEYLITLALLLHSHDRAHTHVHWLINIVPDCSNTLLLLSSPPIFPQHDNVLVRNTTSISVLQGIATECYIM